MAAVAPVESRDAAWSPVLAGIRAEALDCLQANLAAVADRALGAGSHLALGAPLDFRWAVDGAGRPMVDAPVRTRLAEARELLGVRVTERRDGLDGPALRAAAAAGPRYVVADAYGMSWLPYAGRQHLEHSFLLLGGGDPVTVADAYHNDTRWGAARPGVWRLPAAVLDAAVPAGTALALTVDPVPAPDPAAVLAGNARRLAAADIDGYVAAVRAATGRPGAIDQLVLDVWLLSRSRLLHALWRERQDPVRAAAAAERARAWATLGSHVYLALRRGRGTPAPLVEELDRLLREDAEPPGPEPAAAGAAVRAAVEQAVRDVLRIEPAAPVTDRPLRDLPNFDSFRLVEVVARLEERLGVELDADQLSPESLRDVASLARLFDDAAEAVR